MVQPSLLQIFSRCERTVIVAILRKNCIFNFSNKDDKAQDHQAVLRLQFIALNVSWAEREIRRWEKRKWMLRGAPWKGGSCTNFVTSYSRPLSDNSACHKLWEVHPLILQLKRRSWEWSVDVGWGKVCAIFGACQWCWGLDIHQLEVQLGATTEGSCCRRVTGLASQEWPHKRHFARSEHPWFTRTVPSWQLFCNQ